MTSGERTSQKVTPRGRFPHTSVAGELVYVSGTSARRPDNTIAGASVDELGTTALDIRAQTRAVIDNIAALLDDAGAGSVATSSRSPPTSSR